MEIHEIDTLNRIRARAWNDWRQAVPGSPNAYVCQGALNMVDKILKELNI